MAWRRVSGRLGVCIPSNIGPGPCCVKYIVALRIDAMAAKAREEEREACAGLHESIATECDHDLGGLGPMSHPGGMGIVLRYRDAIRARAKRRVR
jgi:hypothetical protein